MVIAALLNTSVKLGKRWLWDTQARMLIGIAIGVVLGWLSVRGMEWGLVADQSQHSPVGWALASLVIIVLANLLRAYRWQLLFVRAKVPLMRLFTVQNAVIGLNNLVPIRVVSERAQFALLTMRYRVKAGAVLFLPLIAVAIVVFSIIGLRPLKQWGSNSHPEESKAVPHAEHRQVTG